MKPIPIVAWKIKVYYSDDTSEDITGVPDDVASAIDTWLEEVAEGGVEFE